MDLRPSCNPPATGFDRAVAVFMQQLLGQIGIAANIDFTDRASYGALRRKGWHNGLFIAAVVAGPNFGNIMRSFMSEGHAYNNTFAIPKDYQQALEASLSSFEKDDELFKKVNRRALENTIAVPILYSQPGPTPAWVSELHDYGMWQEAEWIFNSSEKAWLDK